MTGSSNLEPSISNSDSHLINGSHLTKVYKSYRYRFIMTALFSMANIVNPIMNIGLTTITTNLEQIYSVDIFVVTAMTALVWLFTYPPMNFIANYILDEKGLRAGIFSGIALTFIGLWLRTIDHANFWWIFAGQFFGAMAQPFFMNSPPKLSAVWYPPEQRALATSVAALSSTLGYVLGFLMPQMFVDNDATGSEGRTQVYHLLFYTAVLGSVFLLPICFFFKKKPPTPPSLAAEIAKYSYVESLKHLIKNKNYIIFIIGAGFANGSMNIFGTALQPIAAPYGITPDECGILGAISLVFTLLGGLVWGYIVGRTKRYRFSILVTTTLSLTSLVTLSLVMPTGNFVFTAIVTTFFGFATGGVIPVSYELCMEMSFPVAEAAAGGLMITMTQIAGIIGVLAVDPILNGVKSHSNICFVIVGVGTLLGLILFIIMKEERRRDQAEKGDGLTQLDGLKRSKKAETSLIFPSDGEDLKVNLLGRGV